MSVSRFVLAAKHLWRGRRRCLGDIDTALEIRAIFDDDAAGLDVTHQLGFFLDVDLVGGIHIALDRAVDDDFASFQTGLNAGIRTNRQPVFVAFDRALYFSVDG